MNSAALFAAAGVAITASPAVAAPADARGAIVMVNITGVNTRLGNTPAAAQGTGFFISKDGMIVTAYHVLGDLLKDGVDLQTTEIEINFDPDSPKKVRAQQIFTNQVADLMVLYAPVGGRNVPVLRYADRTTAKVLEATTPIYSVGYPDGIGLSIARGYIKSFDGPRDPIPAWTTDLTFKGGESGSPILLDDNRVIAIAKAVDKGSTSIGLIVPSRLVPKDYWDSDAPSVALASSPGRLLVEARAIPTAPEARTADFTFSNPQCSGARSVQQAIPARAGWTIDPASIQVETVRSIGDNGVIITDRQPDGIRLEARLVNLGQCLTTFGSQNPTDLPAKLEGRVRYQEVPVAAAAEWTPVRDVNLVKAVTTSLPNGPAGDLRFTFIQPNGQAIAVAPGRGELVQTRAGVQLNTQRLLDRLSSKNAAAAAAGSR